MNRQKLQLLGAACICSLTIISQPATAAVSHNQNVTNNAIFGGGNANGSYTVDRANGIELGLRGKLRHNAAGNAENTFNSNGDGTFSFAAGVAPTQSSPTAEWSFEWSINSDYDGSSGYNLNDLTYILGVDSDPGAGATYWDWWDIGAGTGSDLINDANPNGSTYWDHSIGDNTTAQGAGAEAVDAAGYATLIDDYNLAQNSWKAHWFMPVTFDPTLDGEYSFFLAALDGNGGQLARTDMTIIVGAGASVVPVPAAVWLFGTALVGLFGFGKRRKSA